MRFEPITTMRGRLPLFREDGYRALANDIGIFAWHYHHPRTMSELERFLVYGESRSKVDDFHSTSKLSVFDHASCFKGLTGAPFVLTMPYGDIDWFYRNFNELVDDYYREKEQIVESKYMCFGRYSTDAWRRQLRQFEPRIIAAVVPDRFKLRENGDFAAVIATDSWMYGTLAELFQITSTSEDARNAGKEHTA